MKNLKRKNLVLALLVLFALAVTGTSYAYWASKINVPENTTSTGTVTVGTGNAVETSYVLTPGTTTGGALVPTSQLSNSPSGSVSEVVVDYDVQWKENGTTSQLIGTKSTAPITVTWSVTVLDSDGITDQTTLVSGLVVVTPASANAPGLTLGADAQNFVFTITMTEPANKAEYDAISGATITITFTYSLGTVTTTDN